VRWVLALALVGCGVPTTPQAAFPTLDPDETYNTRISNLRTTLARAGITLRVAGMDDDFATADCDNFTSDGKCARCKLAGEHTRIDGDVIDATTRAFRLYPTDVLSAAKIDHLAFCREIAYLKDDEFDHPAGLADVRGSGVLISVKYFEAGLYRAWGDFTMDNIAHHEFFHMLEYAQMRGDMADDPEWRLNNPLGFTYSEEHFKQTRREAFVNSYAATNEVEDKASVYEFMMAHPNELCEMARTDEAIKIKTRIIWRRVLRAVGTDEFIRRAAPCIDWLDV
jgi:hypothetical protein